MRQSKKKDPSDTVTVTGLRPLFIDLETLIRITNLSESTLQREIREGRFPPPRKLSTGRSGWLYTEIELWANGRPVSDLPPPPNTGASKKRHHG